MLSVKMTMVFASASFLRRTCRSHVPTSRKEKFWRNFVKRNRAVNGRSFVWLECMRTSLNRFFDVPTPARPSPADTLLVECTGSFAVLAPRLEER